MMLLDKTILVALFATAATVAIAHTDVNDPHVKARMAGMMTMASELKTLGQMAKGEVAFDETSATTALAALQAETDRIVALFETQANDPKSEASPAIWDDREGFAQRAAEMATVLNDISVSSSEETMAAMRIIGPACLACHKDYRISN